MTPDSVNADNLVWVVAEHQRRLARLEESTGDLGVVRRDVKECDTKLVNLDERVSSIQKALYTAAISVAVSSLLLVAGLTVLLR